MHCTGCKGSFFLGDECWQYTYSNKTPEYYCKFCRTGRIFIGGSLQEGAVAVDSYGNPFWMPIAQAKPCSHSKFDESTLTCAGCGASITFATRCDACYHEYSQHTMGLKGSCIDPNCGAVAPPCGHFVIPASCIPQAPQGNTTCNHPNLGQSMACPDCKGDVAKLPCDTCGCEWRWHTAGNTGPCHGSNCKTKCPHYTMPPVLIYSPFPVVTPGVGGTSAGGGGAAGGGSGAAGRVVWDLKPETDTPVSSHSLKAQRKKDGVCVECGDRGVFVNLQCICSKGHGKIF